MNFFCAEFSLLLFFLTQLFLSLSFLQQMKLKALLLLSGYTLTLLILSCNCEDVKRQGRILNNNNNDNNRKSFDTQVEQQFLQEYSIHATNATEASADDVIEEIINSNRQGRNIEGLEDVYGDANIKEALNRGNDIEARNLIRDKLCDLGLMQCDELIPKRYPTRVIYSQPPPGATIYTGNRPPPPQFNNIRPAPPQQSAASSFKGGQIYGPAKPMPFPPSQPPRKIGFASDLNSYESQSNYYEVDPHPSGIKFGYTEKPTIVVNQQAQQGKREAGGVSQNHHVHHHYVHVDGAVGGNAGGLIDGTKTVLVNTPISEYSAVNSLSSSYQTSGYETLGAASNVNGGFAPSSGGFEYKGVNNGATQPIYSPQKPVYEQNQYASGTNFNKYTQIPGPAVYTEGNNGIYTNGAPQQSFHSSAPDFYKKELNLNGNRGNGLSQSASYQQNLNAQKYLQQQQQKPSYNKDPYSINYQGFTSNRQDQYDCVCVPFDQCPAHDVVGRRDDLILPLDPRHLPSEIEAAENESNATSVTNSTVEVKKISKRDVSSDVQKVHGEGVSIERKLHLRKLTLTINQKRKSYITSYPKRVSFHGLIVAFFFFCALSLVCFKIFTHKKNPNSRFTRSQKGTKTIQLKKMKRRKMGRLRVYYYAY